jgi:dipeptidase D
MVRLLQGAAVAVPFHLSAIDGGNKRNAIPRECHATVYYPPAKEGAVHQAIEEQRAAMESQYRGLEDGFAVQLEAVKGPTAEAFGPTDSRRLLDLLRGLPSGVIAMSQDIVGMVETSNNVGSLRTKKGVVEIACLARSASAPAMRDTLDSILAVARLGGADVEESGGYPGWKPNMSSPVLAVAEKTFRRLFEKDPKVTAIHAGLECGLIGEKVPGMDMVSFGPDIKGPHAPGERVHVPSVERFWALLVGVLDDLSN